MSPFSDLTQAHGAASNEWCKNYRHVGSPLSQWTGDVSWHRGLKLGCLWKRLGGRRRSRRQTSFPCSRHCSANTDSGNGFREKLLTETGSPDTL